MKVILLTCLREKNFPSDVEPVVRYRYYAWLFPFKRNLRRCFICIFFIICVDFGKVFPKSAPMLAFPLKMKSHVELFFWV